MVPATHSNSKGRRKQTKKGGTHIAHTVYVPLDGAPVSLGISGSPLVVLPD